MVDVVVEGATLITMDGERRVISDGVVAIEGDRIVGVGSREEVGSGLGASKVVDGSRCVVMPGMVDLFGHAGHATLRSLGEALDGVTWRNWIRDVALGYSTERWWYVDAQLGAAEKLKYGCTAVLTGPGFSGGRLGDLFPIRQLHGAFEDVGLRGRVVASVGRPPWPQAHATYVDGERRVREVTLGETLDNVERVIADAAANPSELVTYCTGQSRMGNPNPHDPVYDPSFAEHLQEQTARLSSIMERYDVGFYCNGYGNAVEYAYDEGLGVLGPKSIISHGTGLEGRSIEILAETGTSISHNPRARRLYLMGQDCHVVEMIDAGVTVGLGSDGPGPDRSGDPFWNVRGAMHHQRSRFNSQDVLPPGKALEMATIDGYRALGLEEEGGSLEVGKKADLIVIDMFRPNLWPVATPVQQVAYYATGDDVRHVFVNGQHVVDDHQLTTINESDLLEEANDELQRLSKIPELGIDQLIAEPPGFGQTRRQPATINNTNP